MSVNVELIRAMYAEQFTQMRAEIDRLTRRVGTLETELAAANEQIAAYKQVVFKTQMKLDAAEDRSTE